METPITPTNSESKISLTVKEFFSIVIFLISLGITIGGFIKVLSDMSDLKGDVKQISKDIEGLKGDTKNIYTLIDERTTKKTKP